MNSLWRAIGLGGSGVPGFEYTWGSSTPADHDEDEAPSEPYVLGNEAALPWSVKPGVRDEDNLAVSIFEFNTLNATAGQSEMARNVLKMSKTLMLPGVLRTYAAVEYKGIVYIATEPAVPLRRVLHDKDSKGTSYLSYYYEDQGKISSSDAISGERFSNALAFGLKSIATGLAGMHQHKKLHGNVCEDSIFVTKGGEWRMFGLELISGVNEEHSLFRRLGPGQMSELRRLGTEGVFPQNGGDISDNENLVSAVDSWALGCLVHRVYSSRATTGGGGGKGGGSTPAEMRSFRGMPSTLQSCFMSLTGQNPKLRMTTSKFLDSCEFVNNCEYVSILHDLDRLALMDAADRDACYRRLAEHLDTFPVSACKHLVLQQLKKALTFGGGSASVLEPILKMGSRLSAASFSKHVGPIVVAMYNSPDYLVRCRLLSEAGQYARMIPAALFNESIFTSFASGFESRHADIRELTVRSLVHFAPLLTEARLTTDVPKYIQLLQQDREGPIRTNATICLSLISSHIPESIRGKTLVNGFGRMLKDPFIPSKLAALQSINNTMASYTPSQIAEQLLPALSPICVEARSAEVREAAIIGLEKMVTKLKEAHKAMPQSEEEKAPAQPQNQPPGTSHSRTSSTAGSAGGLNKKEGGGFFGGAVKWDNDNPPPISPITGSTSSSYSTLPVQRTAPPPPTHVRPTVAPVASSSAAASKWEDDDDIEFSDDDDNQVSKVTTKTSSSTHHADPSSGHTSLNATTNSIQTTTLRKPMSLNSTTTSATGAATPLTAMRKPGGGMKLGGGLGSAGGGATPAAKRKIGLGGGLGSKAE